MDSYKFYAGIKLISLYTGQPSSLTWNNVGLGQPDSHYKSSTTGFAPYIGGYYKTEDGLIFEGFLSTTPITGIIGPTYTYEASFGYKGKYYATLYRLPVEDSFLSYVGNQVKDLKWGRVVENGIRFGFKFNIGDIGFEDKFTYAYDISGENTVKNSAIKNTFLLYTDLKTRIKYFSDFDHALFGPIFIYQSYKKNTNFYTYGHGGYFSPQSFALMGIFWDLKKEFGKKMYFKFTGNLGFLTFREDRAPKYPLSNTNSNEYYDSNSASTLGYSLKAIFVRKITNRLWLNIFGGLDKSSDYVLFDGGIRLNYYFNNVEEFLDLEERGLKRFSPFRDLYPPN